jgi:hypothetical protein
MRVIFIVGGSSGTTFGPSRRVGSSSLLGGRRVDTRVGVSRGLLRLFDTGVGWS